MRNGLLLACGAADLAFAAFHLMFWRLFGWPESLAASGRLNSAITQTMNIMLTLVFVLYGGKLVALGVQGVPADAYLIASGVLFGLVRSVLQGVLFGLRSAASKAFLAVALTTTALHAAVLL